MAVCKNSQQKYIAPGPIWAMFSTVPSYEKRILFELSQNVDLKASVQPNDYTIGW